MWYRDEELINWIEIWRTLMVRDYVIYYDIYITRIMNLIFMQLEYSLFDKRSIL